MEKLKTDVYSAAERPRAFIQVPPKQPVLLAIDGRCGSGNTTLARVLQEKTGAAVVHMDDFFLRPEQRTPERFAEPGGNVDRERVLEEVLLPLKENCPVVYRPYDTHKPAMLAAVLYRSAGSPKVDGLADFSDVPASAYYNSAARWASNNGYISGYGSRVFGSDDPVTREQIVAILWRYEGRPAATAPDFADESSISTYAGTAVDWARANSIISGVGNNRFDPKGTATRAQVAAILHNYLSTPIWPTTQWMVMVSIL